VRRALSLVGSELEAASVRLGRTDQCLRIGCVMRVCGDRREGQSGLRPLFERVDPALFPLVPETERVALAPPPDQEINQELSLALVVQP
jgi:hypothetical protein